LMATHSYTSESFAVAEAASAAAEDAEEAVKVAKTPAASLRHLPRPLRMPPRKQPAWPRRRPKPSFCMSRRRRRRPWLLRWLLRRLWQLRMRL